MQNFIKIVGLVSEKTCHRKQTLCNFDKDQARYLGIFENKIKSECYDEHFAENEKISFAALSLSSTLCKNGFCFYYSPIQKCLKGEATFLLKSESFTTLYFLN